MRRSGNEHGESGGELIGGHLGVKSNKSVKISSAW
jgi:hypothetical protein